MIQIALWYSLHLKMYVQGLYSLSGKTSYRKISWSLEAARFRFELFQSLWNLAGTSAALLPRCLSNFRAIWPLQHPISRLRDFTRFGGKTSYHLVNRGPGVVLFFLLFRLSTVPEFNTVMINTHLSYWTHSQQAHWNWEYCIWLFNVTRYVKRSWGSHLIWN